MYNKTLYARLVLLYQSVFKLLFERSALGFLKQISVG